MLLPWLCNMIESGNRVSAIPTKDRALLRAGVGKLQDRLPQDWRVELLPLGFQTDPEKTATSLVFLAQDLLDALG